MPRSDAGAPEYRALLLGLLLVLGVLLWPAETSQEAEAPLTATSVPAEEAVVTWPAAVGAAGVVAGPTTGRGVRAED